MLCQKSINYGMRDMLLFEEKHMFTAFANVEFEVVNG